MKLQLIVLLLTALCAKASQIPIPFFVRENDEGGVVAVVFYGDGQGMTSKTINIMCEDTPYTGPGTIDCVPNGEPDGYNLIVPFSFVYNEKGQIVGVDFVQIKGESSNLIIPFHAKRDENGKLVGVSYDKADYGEIFNIPWTTKRDENGTVVGIVYDSASNEQTLSAWEITAIVAGCLVFGLLGLVIGMRSKKVTNSEPEEKPEDDEQTQGSDV